MKYLLPLLIVILASVVGVSVHAQERTAACTAEYAPVCGTKAGAYVTYGNSCMLRAEAAVYAHAGECTSGEIKPVSPEVTSGYVPPKSCTAWFDGCNMCTRQENGEVTCTLRACINTANALPYCSSYDKNPPKNDGVGVVATYNPNATSSPAITVDASAGTNTGFFTNLWVGITGWFSGWF